MYKWQSQESSKPCRAQTVSKLMKTQGCLVPSDYTLMRTQVWVWFHFCQWIPCNSPNSSKLKQESDRRKERISRTVWSEEGGWLTSEEGWSDGSLGERGRETAGGELEGVGHPSLTLRSFVYLQRASPALPLVTWNQYLIKVEQGRLIWKNLSSGGLETSVPLGVPISVTDLSLSSLSSALLQLHNN